MMNFKKLALFLAFAGIMPLQASFAARGLRSTQRVGNVVTAATRIVPNQHRNYATGQSLRNTVAQISQQATQSSTSAALSRGVESLGLPRATTLAAETKTRTALNRIKKVAEHTAPAAAPAQHRAVSRARADLDALFARIQAYQTDVIAPDNKAKRNESKKVKRKRAPQIVATVPQTTVQAVASQPVASGNRALKSQKHRTHGPLTIAPLQRAASATRVAANREAAQANKKAPLVVHPDLLSSAPVPVTITPLSRGIDVFSMPGRPKLIGEINRRPAQEQSMALIPYGAQNRTSAPQPQYRVNVPLQTAGLFGLAQQQSNSDSKQDNESYSWQEKALMGAAAAGAAGLMAAYSADSREDAQDQLAINQHTLRDYFKSLCDALIIVDQQQNSVPGVRASQVDSDRYDHALAVLEQIREAAQKQNLLPCLIEECQLPDNMQFEGEDAVQVIRYNQDGSRVLALTEGLDHDNQLALAKDNAAIGAIISSKKVRLPICLDSNGQQVYKLFYLAFINPNLMDNNSMVAMRDGYNKPLIAISLSPESRELLALAQPKHRALLESQVRELEAPANQPVDSPASYAGSGRNITLELLLRQRPAEPQRPGSIERSPQEFPQLDDHGIEIPDLPAISVPASMLSKAAENHHVQPPKRSAKALWASKNPVQCAVKKYGKEIKDALTWQLPMENKWAGGSTELIEAFKAYNNLHAHWIKNQRDREVRMAFTQCQKQVFDFIHKILKRVA